MQRTLGFRIAGFGMLMFSLTVLADLGLKVENAYLRAMPPGQEMAAAYMTLVNNTDEDIIILRMGSDIVGRIEIHSSTERNGMIGMRKLQQIKVPAFGRLNLEPGSSHLMLMEIGKQLGPGDEIRVTLNTANGGSQDFVLPVKRTTDMNHHH